MSYAGCNFTCENEKCNCYKKSITLTGPWPLAKIDDIIDVTENEMEKQGLLKRKEDGFEMSKIDYPDPHSLKPVALAHERWCGYCKRIQMFDQKIEIVDQENEENSIIEQEELKIPDKCQCGNDYVDVETALKDGINCPFCEEKLKDYRWFVNKD
jgi:hypothetical protein